MNKKSEKIKAYCYANFKTVITKLPSFFHISYLLVVPNIKICLKYFLDKNSPNSHYKQEERRVGRDY